MSTVRGRRSQRNPLAYPADPADGMRMIIKRMLHTRSHTLLASPARVTINRSRVFCTESERERERERERGLGKTIVLRRARAHATDENRSRAISRRAEDVCRRRPERIATEISRVRRVLSPRLMSGRYWTWRTGNGEIKF